MNSPSESSNSQSHFSGSDDILDAEIVEANPQIQSESLEIVNIYEKYPNYQEFNSVTQTSPLDRLLTPWALAAIAVLLGSNILLTWAQLSRSSSPKITENPSPMPILADKKLEQGSESLKNQEISVKGVSTLPQPTKIAPIVPPPPPPISSRLPQTTSSPIQIPSVWRSQPQPQPMNYPVIPPSPGVQVSIPVRNQPPIAIPIPPSLKQAETPPFVPAETPELSKEEQLRNVLRQQIVKEESEIKPTPTFFQKTRQEMLEKTLRSAPSPSVVSPSPSPLPVSQPPVISKSSSSSSIPPASPNNNIKPENLDQLVNQLEGLNRK